LYVATSVDASSLSSSDHHAAGSSDDKLKPEAQAISKEAVQREADASEDPMTKREVSSMEEVEQPAVKEHDFSLYGNYRLRIRSSGDEFKLSDGGSRIGAEGYYQLFTKLKVFHWASPITAQRLMIWMIRIFVLPDLRVMQKRFWWVPASSARTGILVRWYQGC
jgi:hypothetical protein